MLLSVIEIFKTMTALRNAEVCQRDFTSTTFATSLSFIFLIMVLVCRIHTYDAHQSCTGKNRSKKVESKDETLKVSPIFYFQTDVFGCFQKWGDPKMDGFLLKNLIKMDDLGVPLFSETSIWGQVLQVF